MKIGNADFIQTRPDPVLPLPAGKLHRQMDVAVKMLKPGTMSVQEFIKEARKLHKLRHPRLVELIAVSTTSQPVLVITQLMANGSLVKYLRQHAERPESLRFSAQIHMAAQVGEVTSSCVIRV